MIGRKFNRWTVIASAAPIDCPSKSLPRWLCKCECGEIRPVIAGSLKNGSSQSCGCLTRERSSEKHTKHGQCTRPEYAVWQAMNARCFNPNNPRYADYGERGISVCAEWRDFAVFIRDLGDRPSARHSLDRIDNSKGYEPTNCKWSLPHDQMTNRRCTRFVDVDGVKIPLATLAHEHSIPANTLRFRILNGWSLTDALSTPVRPKSSAKSGSLQHRQLGPAPA
jgi:hypothetical protein